MKLIDLFDKDLAVIYLFVREWWCEVWTTDILIGDILIYWFSFPDELPILWEEGII